MMWSTHNVEWTSSRIWLDVYPSVQVDMKRKGKASKGRKGKGGGKGKGGSVGGSKGRKR